jgi:hypothetical protein
MRATTALRAALAALALALSGPRAAAEHVEQVVDHPVRLTGLHLPMTGPAVNYKFHFARPGWVRSLRVDVTDEKGASASGRGILCHTVLRSAEQGPGVELPAYGLSETPISLSTDENGAAIELPDGFGLRVDTSTEYHFQGRLQSSDVKNDGLYTFKIAYDFVPEGESAPLKTLKSFRVLLDRQKDPLPDGQWPLTPGRHSFSYGFGSPDDLDVHLLSFHFHQYATAVELIDAKSGKVLYHGDATPRPDGFSSRPFYSSAEGFPLTKDARYIFRGFFDNTSQLPQKTMAVMWIYASKREASPKK